MFHSHRRPLLIGEDFKTFNELELEVFLFLFFKAGVEEGEETLNILQRDAQHLMRRDTADVIITALSNQAPHWLRTQSSPRLAPSFKSGMAQNIALHASLAARNSDFLILESHPQDALGVGSADPTEPSSVPADGDPHGVREYVTFAVILQSRLYLHTVTLRQQKQRINKTCSCLRGW